MVAICRVPVQHDIDIVEEPRPHHVDLARTAFFGRLKKQFHGAAQIGFLLLE